MPDIREYKITNVQQRDEWQSTYGMMMDYAVALEGEEGWIKLTQKLDTKPPQIGQTIEGYIETKSNTNGTTYRKFKKESAQYAQKQGGSTSPHLEKRIEYIVQMLEELTGRKDIVHEVSETSSPELDDPFKDL